MRNKLKEYIPLSESKKKQIWKKGIFVLDANVLLNMCRYSKKSCDELLKILKSHKNQLWLPYQVGMEFLNNRLKVIETIKCGFDQLLSSVSKVDDNLASVLRFSSFKNDSAHNIEQLRRDIIGFRKREEAKIRKWQKEYEDSDKEAILDELLSLYDGRVGDDYDDKRLRDIYEEGAVRYEKNVPPGFADYKEKEKEGERHLYGDLIWWFQTIDYARENKCDIIIITDDRKEDWWYKVSGKTLGPRVELIREFERKTDGCLLMMYKTHQFMEMAKQLDGATVSKSSLEEVELTSLSNALHMFDPFRFITDSKQTSNEDFLQSRYGISLSPHLDNRYSLNPTMEESLYDRLRANGLIDSRSRFDKYNQLVPGITQSGDAAQALPEYLKDFGTKTNYPIIPEAPVSGISDVLSQKKDK